MHKKHQKYEAYANKHIKPDEYAVGRAGAVRRFQAVARSAGAVNSLAGAPKYMP